MRQKFVLQKDPAKRKLVITESSELDKDMFSVLCRETYDYERIEAAISRGKAVLMTVLRTRNLYPPGVYTARLAEAITEMFTADGGDMAEIMFQDIDLIKTEKEEAEAIEILDDDTDEIDDLLEEDFPANYEEKSKIKKINAPIKVADEESVSYEDDV